MTVGKKNTRRVKKSISLYWYTISTLAV